MQQCKGARMQQLEAVAVAARQLAEAAATAAAAAEAAAVQVGGEPSLAGHSVEDGQGWNNSEPEAVAVALPEAAADDRAVPVYTELDVFVLQQELKAALANSAELESELRLCRESLRSAAALLEPIALKWVRLSQHPL